jgi:hypothetical protein
LREPKTNIWIVLLVFGVAVAIAVLDWLPQTSAVPWHVLFVIPVVWLALWSAEDDAFPVTMMAIIVTGLLVIPGYFSSDPSSMVPLGDRFIVIGTIWATVLLALSRKRARRTYKWITLIGGR